MSMIDMFLKGVGFDPTEFAQACEYYKKEFELMKSGLQGAVGHFNNELKEIKAGQAVINENVLRLERKLDAYMDALTKLSLPSPEIKPNGHDNIGNCLGNDTRHPPE